MLFLEEDRSDDDATGQNRQNAGENQTDRVLAIGFVGADVISESAFAAEEEDAADDKKQTRRAGKNLSEGEGTHFDFFAQERHDDDDDRNDQAKKQENPSRGQHAQGFGRGIAEEGRNKDLAAEDPAIARSPNGRAVAAHSAEAAA